MSVFPSTSTELSKILENTKCVILKFSASWCGPCKNKKFLEEYHNLKDIFANDKNVLFLEFDVDEHEELISGFNITAVPTIMVFNSNVQISNYTGAGNLNKVKDDILRCI